MAVAPDELPLPHRILDAAEGVLRRHGPEKTNVVDIAKVLGMSHGNIYRHFPNKKALLEAVASRWLHAVTDPLQAVAENRSLNAAQRLKAWFDTLRAIKQNKMICDPEMFQMHYYIVQHSREVVSDHVAVLQAQVAGIIAEGVANGEFAAHLKPKAAAQAFFMSTYPFHHPALLQQHPGPRDEEAAAVFDLLLAGLRAGPA
ncbi:MAG: TetR family transcriptional regulator [Akkermansiaceae bacterium]|nr:TetR family transcriptional regulator [Akkermansiaceae bacterium]